MVDFRTSFIFLTSTTIYYRNRKMLVKLNSINIYKKTLNRNFFQRIFNVIF